METIETIIQWHKGTFPDTNLFEQTNKYFKESREFDEDNSLEELADMFIVACGLCRFNTVDCLWCFSCINERMCFLIEKGIMKEVLELNKAVDEKMSINRKRQWHKVNGEWRHK